MELDKVNPVLDKCADDLSAITEENQFILAAGSLGEEEAVSMRVRCDTMASLGLLMTAMISEISAYQEWDQAGLMKFMRQLITAVSLARWGEDTSVDDLIRKLSGSETDGKG